MIKEKKIKGLQIHVMQHAEVKEMGIAERVKKILGLVLGNKIVIFHGRLRAEEEARLIEDTMAMVDHIKSFKGIELAVVNPSENENDVFARFKSTIATTLLGNRQGFTIIGPATVIKNIKREWVRLYFKR